MDGKPIHTPPPPPIVTSLKVKNYFCTTSTKCITMSVTLLQIIKLTM